MAFDPISAGLGLANTIIDKIFPDKTKAEEAKAALKMADLTNEFQLYFGQIQTNIEEAKSGKVFIAGWRPFCGWVGGSALAWNFVIGPMFYWISCLLGKPTPIPILDLTTMMPVILGMLGLGAYRTIEKVNGTEGNR